MATRLSIEIGEETTKVACGSLSERGGAEIFRAEIAPTEGFYGGEVRDEERLKERISELVERVTNGVTPEMLQFILPHGHFTTDERIVTLNNVRFSYDRTIKEAAHQCRKNYSCREGYEVMDMVPLSIVADGVEGSIPSGVIKRLEIKWRIYVAKSADITAWSELFNQLGFRNIVTLPADNAYGRAFSLFNLNRKLAIVDLGAEGINVLIFRDGFLTTSEHLPIGCSSIDGDIAKAFGIEWREARELKIESGEALRYLTQPGQVQIPGTMKECSASDLAMVVQSRMEELLEGVTYILKQDPCNLGIDVVLTGGGAKLRDVALLFEQLSGLRVRELTYSCARCNREEILSNPEFALVVGALFAEVRDEEKRDGFWGSIFG